MGCGDSSLVNAECIQAQPPRDDLNDFFNGIQASASPPNQPSNVLAEVRPLSNNQIKPQSEQKIKNTMQNASAQIKHENVSDKQNHEINNLEKQHKQMEQKLNIEKQKVIENLENQIIQDEKNRENIENNMQQVPLVQQCQKQPEKLIQIEICQGPKQTIKPAIQQHVQKPHVLDPNFIQQLQTQKIDQKQQENKLIEQNLGQSVNEVNCAVKKNIENPSSYRSATDSVLIREQIKQNQEQLAKRLAEKLENCEGN